MNTEAAYDWCEADHAPGGEELRLRHPPAPHAGTPGALGGLRAGPAHRRHRRRRRRGRREARRPAARSARTSTRSIRRRTTRCSSPWPTPQRRYGLPMDCFGEIIEGCEMDVLGTSYETIDDLVDVLPARGGLGRPPVAGRLRHRRPRARGPARRRPRRRPPAHEHPARRRRGPVRRARLPAGATTPSAVGCAPDLTGPPAASPALVALRVRPRRASGSPRACSCCRCSTAAAGACVVGDGRHLPAPAGRGSSATRSRSPGARLVAQLGEGSRSRRGAWRGAAVSAARESASSEAAWPGSPPRSQPRDAGAEVVLFERRPALGGLTSSIRTQRPLLRQRPARLPALLHRLPRTSRPDRRTTRCSCSRGSTCPCSRRGGARASIRRTGLPAPLHLPGSLARYRHLSLRERLRLGRPPSRFGVSIRTTPRSTTSRSAPGCASHGQSDRAIDRLWDLIALPTLNVPAREASLALADEGVPDRAPRPVRRRGHRLGDGPARRAARGQRRPRPRRCRCRGRARRRRRLVDRSPSGSFTIVCASQADGRGLRRGRHAAAGGSNARCLRRRCGRAARDVPDRQRPPASSIGR